MTTAAAAKDALHPWARSLLRSAQAQLPLLQAKLEELVRLESPSHNKAQCDRALLLAADWSRALGGAVRMHRHRDYADSLEVRFQLSTHGRRSRPVQRPVMLLGHLDTVWPEGTLSSMPFRITRDRIYGPGVLDMKTGVAMAFAALRMLREAELLRRPVTLLLHGDEEIGSPASRAVTEKIARECEAVYVLEPAQGLEGAYKTARKGVAHYRLAVQGIASHSGIDFLAGHSATVELAHQLTALTRLTDLKRGLTVNPGVIGGGTLANVVAAEAWAEIDVRIARAADAAPLERRLHRLRPLDRACTLTWSGGVNRPPMERTRATGILFSNAKEYAGVFGFALEEASTGGGSDGNFTAALGVPTLDGMGAVGEGAHAPHESVLRKHLAPRTALLAAMCANPSAAEL